MDQDRTNEEGSVALNLDDVAEAIDEPLRTYIDEAIDQISDLPSSSANRVAALERCSTLDPSSIETLLSGGLDHFYAKLQATWRKNNLSFPTPEIHFDNISFSVRTSRSDSHDHNSIGAFFRTLLCPWRKLKTTKRVILHPMSGVIRPGSMTLVLATPGSGKSTLLKALAGKLPPRSGRLKGEIRYSNLRAADIDISKLVGLMDQRDCHYPALTVRETLLFADRCLNGLPKRQPNKLEQVAQLRTEICLSILGLTHCANTVVGDELLRGVSGGERKRVTVGEMLVGGQTVFLCDEISTGLDSAATFDIMKSLQTWTRTLGGSAVVILLQPPPEVVELFDDLLILAHGHMLYHGPRVQVSPYFQSLGLERPEDVDLAEFIVDVISGRAKDYRKLGSNLMSSYSSADFAQRFRASTVYAATLQYIVDKKRMHEKTRSEVALQSIAKQLSSSNNSAFGANFLQSTMIVFDRQKKIWLRDKLLIGSKVSEAVLVGLLLGIIFYKVSDRIYLRVIFFVIAIFQRQAWQQLTIGLQNRNIFYKQRLRNFYRTFSYSLAESVVQIPLNLCVSLSLTTIYYFMVGLSRSSKTVFLFYAIVVSFQHAIASYFAFLAALSPSVTIAQGLASLSVSFFLLFSGNIILPDLIPMYWKWMHWFNPVAWALRSALLNEYHSSRYSRKEREAALARVQISKGPDFIWIGIIVLLSYYVLFTLLTTAALHFLRFDAEGRSSASTSQTSTSESGAQMIENGKKHFVTPIPSSDVAELEVVKAVEDKVDVIKPKISTPCIPAFLSVEDLSYFVNNPSGDEQLQLLHGVCAFFAPGKMAALMGSSGAGKTTFMDVLAGRKTGGRISGKILLNGEMKDPRIFSRIAGYCEQMDIHSGACTVKESLEFSARLRLARETSVSERAIFLQQTLTTLELDEIANVLIDNCSIEQKKRVTVGVEVVANPSILFLDEPTSGLDARSALTLMKGVLRIARSGRTVLCTIHQPSLQLFNLFDDLLLLQKGGYTAYFGNLGPKAANMLSYFSSLPNVHPMQPKYNPATYMLEVIGAGIGRNKGRNFSDEYKASPLCASNLELQSKLRTPNLNKASLERMLSPISLNQFRTSLSCSNDGEQYTLTQFSSLCISPVSTHFYTQCAACVKKMSILYWRNPQYNVMRVVAFPIYALIFGSTFFNLAQNTIPAVNSHIGLIYNTLDFIGVTNLMTVLNIVTCERAVFYRERMSNYYDPLPYALSLMVAEVPYVIVTALLFLNVEYWMTGWQRTAPAFFLFYFIFLVHISVATCLGQLVGLLMPNIKVANVTVGLLSIIFNLYAGFLMLHPMMKPFYSWVRWLIPTNYSLSSLASIEVGTCSSPKDHGCILLKSVHQRVEQYVAQTYGFYHSDIGRNIGVLIAMWAFIQIAIYLTLRFVSHLKR